jgi:hypothetical protein
MRVPIFVSAPSLLSHEQSRVCDGIDSVLEDLGLERRTLGKSDYPSELPLTEVMQLARRCSGGVILGFAHVIAKAGLSRAATGEQTHTTEVPFPTPWNNLEAGILFSLRLPLLVFKEKGITGGVFDHGVSDVFIHEMPSVAELTNRSNSVREIMLKWQARVRGHYYEWEK